MIGRLKGILIEKQPPQLLVDIQGVGYEVEAPMTTFYKLPELGSEITLHIHFIVREDAQQLYGFASQQERSLFRILIKVNGVGPKLALTVLSNFEPNAFVQCVMQEDDSALIRVPGVGKKTAQRLIIEMRDRLKDWYDSPSQENMPTNADLIASKTNYSQEAISALVALGYKPQEASRAVANVEDNNEMNCEEIIRYALQSFAVN